MGRIYLPNDCSYTEPVVFPFNWDVPQKKEIDLDKDWYIKYRFYDPAVTTGTYAYPKGRQIMHKSMNKYKTLAGRRDATKILLQNELDLLSQGYNPITNILKKKAQAPAPEPQLKKADHQDDDEDYEISPDTPFIPALKAAFGQLEVAEGTKDDIRKALPAIYAAIEQLHYENLPISQVHKKHVKRLLIKIGKNKEGWSASNFNHHRSYLMMLFDELNESEATDIDPVTKIKKKKEVKHLKVVPSARERNKIHVFLKTRYYTFWRFIQIFFHSGARLSEMVRIKKEDVDLENQQYKALILKGTQYVEVWKVIKDIALPYWKEVYHQAEYGQYLFSVGLKPGDQEIEEHQITKRWRMHVKKKLGVVADIYSLKHLNTTEMVDILDQEEEKRKTAEEEAAKLNSHTTTAMVVSIYDIKQKTRRNDRIKRVANPFAEDPSEKSAVRLWMEKINTHPTAYKTEDGRTDLLAMIEDAVDYFGIVYATEQANIRSQITDWATGFLNQLEKFKPVPQHLAGTA